MKRLDLVAGCIPALALFVGLACLPAAASRAAEEAAETAAPAAAKPARKDKADPYAWKSLFDGKTLTNWKSPNFGGEGKVYVKDGCIVMEMGSADMSGIVWTGDEPLKTNYELELDGKRVQGGDFFCTTTFPVGDESCSFVVGGWAGTIVGLSCVNWYDASDNETTDFVAFEDNKWYHVRIRFSDAKIECWIDDEKLVDLPRKGNKFSVRMECDPCLPLGVATFQTEGWVKNIRIRKLKPEEVAEAAKEK